MAKIYAKNEEYTGVSASVGFVNGVGETSDPYLIEWFREHGYAVVEDEEETNEETSESTVKEEKKNGRKK